MNFRRSGASRSPVNPRRGLGCTATAPRRLPATADGNGGAGGGRGAASADRPKGTDLLLRDLASGAELNVGNVSEFSFRKDGRLLAVAIDAADKAGNGVQIRDMTSGAVSPIDSADASYEHLAWSEKGDALAVLKGTDNRAYRDKFYSVIGVTAVGTPAQKKVTFDPSADASVPKGFSISPNRAPEWTDDLEALVFGLYEPREKDAAAAADEPAPGAEGGENPRPAGDAANGPSNDEKVDLVLWHYKDPRLQTQQEVQEARDRAYSYVSEFRLGPKKFIRLADDELRTVTVNTKESHWAFGTDDCEYQLMGSLDGRRYEDVYAVNLETGERKPAIRHLRYFSGASPDGSQIPRLHRRRLPRVLAGLRPGPQHHAGAAGLVRRRRGRPQQRQASGQRHRLGERQQDRAPHRRVGRLEGAGRRRRGREPHRQREEGRDPLPAAVRDRVAGRPRRGNRLTKPVYFHAYGEWTKKGGIARIDPGAAGAKVIGWADASYPQLMKAGKSDVYRLLARHVARAQRLLRRRRIARQSRRTG